MVKNMKKRSVSESEAIGKAGELNANKALKKAKVENGAVRNEKTNKGIKKDALKKLAIEKKKEQSVGVVQSSVKKPMGDVNTEKSKKKVVDGKEEKQQKVKEQRLQSREKRNLKRQQKNQHGVKSELSAAELKQKIEEIEKRGSLTKTAKRKLATLKKVLSIKEGTFKPVQQVAKKQAGKLVEVGKKKQIQNNEQKKKLPEKPEVKTNKVNKKKDAKQGNLLLLKQNDSDEDEDDDDDDDDDDDVETDNDVDEEDEDEDEDNVDVDEEEEEEDDEEEGEEEDSEDDDDDDETDVEDEATTNDVQSPKAKEKSKQNTEQEGKKKRYVLFVGNLPYSITNEELKKHFLTKVSQVIDIRIPKKDANTSRGFAYVELANNTDYEKALSLNHSFVNGRRINVQYSGGAGNKKDVVAKNFKLQALQRAGKLAGGYNKNNQKFGGKKWKQQRQTTKT